MKYLDKLRLAFVTAFTALNGVLGTLAIPFYFLVAANLIDYFTGIAAAIYRGEKVQSSKGFRGILKKICMWLLVAIGYALDYCLVIMTSTFGVTITFKCLVAAAVIFWLLANELMSILENMHDIGAPLPPFLMKLVTLMKSATEDAIDIEEIKSETSQNKL